MKFFHKKFLNDEQVFDNSINTIPTGKKTKLNYFLNQLLIWMLIFIVVYFIISFLNINFNFN